jgi:Superfamily I DNA and RNA helicases
MDFDDLLEKTLRMLKEHEHIADFYRRQFQFILVDEYQDTNKIQADFIDTLAAEHRNVMVVGDDAQSIYSWRGANFKNILAFPSATRRAGVQDRIELPERAGNSAGGERRDCRERETVPKRAGRDQDEQFLPACGRGVKRRERAGPLYCPTNPGAARRRRRVNDIAVLYRAHYHAIELQLELSRRGIPYVITSGVRFFEQAHVKDVTAFVASSRIHAMRWPSNEW